MDQKLKNLLEESRKNPYKPRFADTASKMKEEGEFGPSEDTFDPAFLHEKPEDFEIQDKDGVGPETAGGITIAPENTEVPMQANLQDLNPAQIEFVKNHYGLFTKEETEGGEVEEYVEEPVGDELLSVEPVEDYLRRLEPITRNDLAEDAKGLLSTVNYSKKLSAALAASIDKSTKLGAQDALGLVEPAIETVMMLVMLSGDPETFQSVGAGLKTAQDKVYKAFTSANFAGELQPIAKKLGQAAKTGPNIEGGQVVGDANPTEGMEGAPEGTEVIAGTPAKPETPIT